MREIKFRLWDARNKRFGYLQIQANLVSWPNNIWMSQNNIGEAVRFDDVTDWQEYTGLKDRSGKEIFEGDIVMRRVFNYHKQSEVESWRGVVEMQFGEWSAMTTGLWRLQDHVEVIGNIYENGNLLNAQSEAASS